MAGKIVFSFVSFSILILDQWAKYAAGHFLTKGGSVPVINGVFHLTLVHNQGAAFGIFKGSAFLFIAATVFCLIAIPFFLYERKLFTKIFGIDCYSMPVLLSLALVFGGACGNLIDRLRVGYVIDFLDFRVWPVFNIADSAITIGGILLGYKMLRRK